MGGKYCRWPTALARAYCSGNPQGSQAGSTVVTLVACLCDFQPCRRIRGERLVIRIARVLRNLFWRLLYSGEGYSRQISACALCTVVGSFNCHSLFLTNTFRGTDPMTRARYAHRTGGAKLRVHPVTFHRSAPSISELPVNLALGSGDLKRYRMHPDERRSAVYPTIGFFLGAEGFVRPVRLHNASSICRTSSK
jgi:hypothetical protein